MTPSGINARELAQQKQKNITLFYDITKEEWNEVCRGAQSNSKNSQSQVLNIIPT